MTRHAMLAAMPADELGWWHALFRLRNQEMRQQGLARDAEAALDRRRGR